MALATALGLVGGAHAQQPPRQAPEIEAGLTSDQLDNGYADWRSAYVNGGWQDDAGRAYSLGWARTERFDLYDTQWTAGIALPLAPRWRLAADATTSSTHAVLPRLSGQLQVQYEPARAWGLSATVRRALYEPSGLDQVQGTSALGIGVEHYLGNWRLAWNGLQSHPDAGGQAFVQWVQVDRYYGEQGPGLVSRIGLLASGGRELENQPGRGLVESSVTGVVVLGLHRLDRHWGLSWELSSQRQGDYYRRTGLRLGIRHTF